MSTPLSQLIRTRRQAARLSRARLADRASISESTLKNLEAGRHHPTQSTLQQLLAIPELALSPADLFAASPGLPPDAPSPMNCLILPGFDPIAMAHDLATRLAGRGGALEQSFLYLDTKSAACWFAIANQSHYAHARDLRFLHDLAAAVHLLTGPEGVDLIGLGCGDGNKEVRLCQHLLAQAPDQHPLLYLLDISQPLLGYAFQHAASTLAHAASVFAIQGNFHHLPLYSQLLHLPHRPPRRRLFCLFGGTFGNLDNEVRFVRDNLCAAAPGDLLLLHVSAAYAPRDQPDQIQRQDPLLAGTLPKDLYALIHEWLTGPIERYSRPVGAPLPHLEVQAHLDTTACPVTGSYAIEHRVRVCSPGTEPRCFTVAYVKRYDAAGLAACMDAQGWEPLRLWDHETGNMILALFRRR